jgi:hypothetical protein
VEIKIKWIKRKQMTHENTYRVDTCAHPKWQNSQSDDGGRSTEEEEEQYLREIF